MIDCEKPENSKSFITTTSQRIALFNWYNIFFCAINSFSVTVSSQNETGWKTTKRVTTIVQKKEIIPTINRE